MSELHDLTALEQAGAVRARRVSPVELVRHYLGRIDTLDAQVGAFVTVTAEGALTAATAAEAAVLAGGDLPALHGVPVPVKDLTMVEGVRATFGSAAYDDFVAPEDDGVVTRLRDAGMVLLGKTNTCEFGLSCYTESAVAPPARTPWDLDRSAGGSSGGAGAAVAAGLAPVAHGSDGGGSVRIPASVCGLVGLKPTRGLVSSGPRLGDVSGLATSGPLARTVPDAAALLDAMAGPWPGDPWPVDPPAGGFLAACDRDPGRLRVGCWAEPVLADAPVHAECLAALEVTRALLADLGHDVLDAPPPFGPDLVASFEAVWATLSALTPVADDREERLLPLTRWFRARAATLTGADYARSLASMQAAARAAAQAWAAYDVLLCPTLAQPPARVGALRDDADPAADFEAQKRFSPFCAVYNVTGQPALSLPLHWSADGLPIGVMVAGPRRSEPLLLALSAQVEAARPWRHRRPPGLW